MKPVLSICIPTYNRCNYLVETLESILLQLTPAVEIVISDNASTDDTASAVSDYVKKYDNIRYSCAEKNCGPDANFLRVVSLARGEYCWLLSDDDTIKPGAVETILMEIQGHHDIYTFNETTCDNRLVPIVDRQRLAVPDGRLEYDLSKSADLVLFFERSEPVGGIPFGLISVLVFKKATWDAVTIPPAMIGTAYVHVYVLLGGKAYGSRLKYLPQSLIMNRLNESYISTDPIRSFWITADGYQLLADALFSAQTDTLVRGAFLAMAKRIFSLRHLTLFRLYSPQNEEWQRIRERLMQLGYNRSLLKIIGACRLPLSSIRSLLKIARKLTMHTHN
jgi:abequosyltransferase